MRELQYLTNDQVTLLYGRLHNPMLTPPKEPLNFYWAWEELCTLFTTEMQERHLL